MPYLYSKQKGTVWGESRQNQNERQSIVRLLFKKVSLSQRITSSLYNKYAESQNYYYTKVINDLILNQPTKATIWFKDLEQYDQEVEQCKKLYSLQSYPKKIKILVEFYRFHKDIPRWAVNEQIVSILNEFYNQRRKLEYYKIQHLIELENQQNPNRTPKGIVGEQPQESQSTPKSSQESGQVVGNVLDELNTELKQRTQTQQSEINEIISALNANPMRKQPNLQQIIKNQQFILNEQRLQQFINSEKLKKINLIINQQKATSQTQRNYKQKQDKSDSFKTQNFNQNCWTSRNKTSKTAHAQILSLLKQRVKVKLELKNKMKAKAITSNTSLRSLQKNIESPTTTRNVQLQKQRFNQKKSLKANTFHVNQSSKNLIVSLLANRNTTVHVDANQKNLLLAKLNILNTPRQILN
ncbi:unnamed protein product (macronuclear) [Paramecium tetraurelia]|uniref:Uncharacterized protein n=1 Tax=Paramecium tetraurelia TaxID=5888 RepID=A0BIL5_PARTE|nr:uncharacterized protein GSPATT00004754001 [Paramecium tetraurelia]CAK58382.1 unnamed protein product [Paramecium tetraurelia]|eukprot:XP_001425780.1 hypothetical protein (macronuclear) [Paramecium tetraurelia strain d4-2]